MIYKEYLGMTQRVEVRQRGENWLNKEFKQGKPKHVFGYKYKSSRRKNDT